MFQFDCVNISAGDSYPGVIVNKEYSYFNITGSWVFKNLNFQSDNSIVNDPLGLYDLRVIPW